MRVAIGSDHAGFELKDSVTRHVRRLGIEVLDFGTDDDEPVDYPDIAEAVGHAVVQRKADRGIVVCGSGVGASIAANKVPGVRAALCHDTYSAHQGVEHADMNVLVLGARIVGEEMAIELVQSFLTAAYLRDDRDERRLGKVRALEARFGTEEQAVL